MKDSSLWWEDQEAELEAYADTTKSRTTFNWDKEEHFNVEKFSFSEVLNKLREGVTNSNDFF